MRGVAKTCSLIFMLMCTLSQVNAAGESEALPERYTDLGLKPLKEVFDFKYRSFRDGDRQSLIVRTRGREIYLLVFDRPISPRNQGLQIRDRNLRAGFTRVSIVDNQLALSRRIDAIYQLENRDKENEVVKFLRAND